MIDPQHPVLLEFSTRFPDLARDELTDHRQAVLALYAHIPALVQAVQADSQKIVTEFADELQIRPEHVPDCNVLHEWAAPKLVRDRDMAETLDPYAATASSRHARW